jgi:hypothetical protein
MRKERLTIAALLVAAVGLVAVGSAGVLNHGSTGRLYTSSSSSSSGGGFTDGQSITIDGSGFGTFSGTRMVTEDTIEAAANGTHVLQIAALTSAGWEDPTESDNNRWHDVSTSSPLVGGKVILAQSFGGDGRFGMAWNTGATITRAYLRDYVQISTDDPTPIGQWKMVRFTSTLCVTDDDPANGNFFNWFNNSFDTFQSNEGPGCGGGATNVDQSSGDYQTAMGVWYEREIELVPGTQGGADGIVQIRFRRVSDWVQVSNQNHTDAVNYDSNNTSRYQYIIYQDYQGNGLADGTVHSAVRIDCLFAQVGSRQRVYISPQSTWTAVLSTGPRELLDRVTGWSNTQITGTLRQGILTSGHLAGPLYAYVFDDNGSVVNSSGIQIQAFPLWLLLLLRVRRAANDDRFDQEGRAWAA